MLKIAAAGWIGKLPYRQHQPMTPPHLLCMRILEPMLILDHAHSGTMLIRESVLALETMPILVTMLIF